MIIGNREIQIPKLKCQIFNLGFGIHLTFGFWNLTFSYQCLNLFIYTLPFCIPRKE